MIFGVHNFTGKVQPDFVYNSQFCVLWGRLLLIYKTEPKYTIFYKTNLFNAFQRYKLVPFSL